MPRGHEWEEEEEPGNEAEESQLDDPAVVPTGLRREVRYTDKEGREGVREKIVLHLRACLSCRLIMSEEQFYENGCPNCSFLQLDGNRHGIFECTTPNFNGMIALLKPNDSWVARFNELRNRVPGCYAVTAHGDLPESIIDQHATELRDMGYIRDVAG